MSVKHILVIDNEPYIQEVAQIALETVGGWQVTTAGSGQEGVRLAAAKQPDAILLDVMMPEMDGLETFRKLQSNSVTQNIPVLLLTAKVQVSDREKYQAMGIKATISKPFEPLQLSAIIANAMGWE